MITPTLTTERLILRPAVPERDAAAMFAIFSHPQVMRFMPSPPHETIAQTQAEMQAKIDANGAHLWTVYLKDSDIAIGEVHYLGNTRIPGMGYITHPDYWGQGYTPEACRAALDVGFHQLGLDRVELWIDETNAASLRVAHKLGFSPKGRIGIRYNHMPQSHYMLVYGLLARDWPSATPTIAAPVSQLWRVEPVLMVHDVAATAAFYRDKLGFHVDFLYGDPPEHGGVSRGEWTGSLVTIQLSQVPPERALTPAGYLYIVMDHTLDDLHAQYQANGVTIRQAPQSQPWGLREFAIEDNNGQVLVFATYGA